MITLRLKFDNEETPKEFAIVEGELLSTAVDRATSGIPLGPLSVGEVFTVLINGIQVRPDMWDKISLKSDDSVLVTPLLRDGDFGQVFKQILIIAVSIVATVYLSPAVGGGVYGALAVAGVTIAATLTLNALIPPPTPNLGGLGDLGGDGPSSSQMYAITGQSNQLNRLGVVPKVYGTHRIFPLLAANPYTELAVNPITGEVIQYLVSVYDFGLGSPIITDIKIGDTPLSAESFSDFQYRLVDPNKPDVGDDFDSPLEKEFELYKQDRTVTPLSIALADGQSNTQLTDDNPKNLPIEIILDMVCPRGLYGYSSGGALGDRRISLIIEFALDGTSDWKSYNDLSVVDGFRAVGGTDFTDFPITPVVFSPADAAFGNYYANYPFTTAWDPPRQIGVPATYDAWRPMYFKPGGNRVALPKPGASDSWDINTGTKLMLGSRLLGIIQSKTDMGTYYDVVLDRVVTGTYDIRVFDYFTRSTWNGSSLSLTYLGPAHTMLSYVASRHTTGAAAIEGSNTNPVYASFRFTPKVTGKYKVRLRRVSTSGVFTQQVGDDLTWGAITTSFLTDSIKTDKRHVFLELRIRATDQLNGQIQNLSAVVTQPVDVYDPDTATWSRQPTRNPAWVFCDLITGEVNKKAISKSRLHLDSILAWADYCDEIPTPPPSQAFTKPRFECNFILDYEATLQEVLQSVSGAAQASLNIIDGKYGVLVDKLKTVPVQIFTPRNSSGFSSNRFYAPRPHGVKVKYIDPNLAWETQEVVVYDNGYDEETATEFDELTSFACTNNEQAWRFGRYMIAQNRLRQETISLLVDFENLVCTRGDYVQITQDVMQVGGRPARVKSVSGSNVTIDDAVDISGSISYGYTYRSKTGAISTSTLTPVSAREFTLDGDIPEVGDLIVIGEVGKLVLDCIVKSIQPNDDMSAQLTLVERANDIFDYESTDVLPDYDPSLSQTSRPDFSPPNAVTDLSIQELGWRCADTLSGYQYYVDVTWNIPVGSVYEHFQIWYNNGSGYRSVATTNNKFWRQEIDESRLGSLMGLKVVAVAASGNKLQLVSMPEVTFTPTVKSTPPSDVEGFGMSITDQVLQLAWNSIDDCDVFKYEIRYSPEVNDIWEASVPLQTVDRNVNSLSVQARSGVYLIKAIDFAGNKSVNAVAAITTIPDLFNLNVIETLNDAPLFAGFFEQTEKLGSAVILSEEIHGDVDTMEYYSDGYYIVKDVVDLGEIYSARLQSLIRADGFRFGELMSEWDHLADVDHLGSAETDEWDISVEYRATTEILSMASWAHLYDVAHLNEGLGQGFTDWRPIPTIGDATGRVFQFRVHLKSITPNVTPRLFDGTIKVDMPDRIESQNDLESSATDPVQVTYSTPFAGPSPSPSIQISIDNGQSGDYWVLENKNLEGFQIRIYDNTDTQVVRQFDVLAKGYGRRHVVTI